jgi:hypothetical protein
VNIDIEPGLRLSSRNGRVDDSFFTTFVPIARLFNPYYLFIGVNIVSIEIQYSKSVVIAVWCFRECLVKVGKVVFDEHSYHFTIPVSTAYQCHIEIFSTSHACVQFYESHSVVYHQICSHIFCI